MRVIGYHHTQASLLLGMTRYPLNRGPRRSQGSVWKGAWNLAPPPEFDPRIVQPVASRCTDWATLAPNDNRFDINRYNFKTSICIDLQQLSIFVINNNELLNSGEISPARCNNCVFYSHWLYSTCFGWQSHPSSGVQCCIWPQVSWLT